MEAFHRLKRSLKEWHIHLIFCSLGSVSYELARSGLFDLEGTSEVVQLLDNPANPHTSPRSSPGDHLNLSLVMSHPSVQNFDTLNEALEYCENLLVAEYYHVKAEFVDVLHSSHINTNQGDDALSLRSNQVRDAALRVLKGTFSLSFCNNSYYFD